LTNWLIELLTVDFWTTTYKL